MLNESFGGQRLLALVFGTLHSAVLILLTIFGDSSDVAIDAAVGLSAVLVVSSLYVSFRWLGSVYSDGRVDMASLRYWRQSALWGGLGGVLFALLVAFFLTVFGLPIAIARDGLADGLTGLVFPALIAMMGSIIGFLIGALLGLIFGLLDGLLLKAWGRLRPRREAPRV
jgi:hypothetical protein